MPAAKGFRKQWLFVDAGTRNPLLLTPRAPVVPSSGWGHVKLTDRWLARVWKRLARLQELEVTAPMVVKEFVQQRVAPLQHHSRPTWTLFGSKDRMRLHESGLPLEAQRSVLEVLTGDPSPANMPEEGCLLYCCSNRVEFARQMPPFDEWGLRPVGLEGPRENPVPVVPLLATSTDLTPRVGAGGTSAAECWSRDFCGADAARGSRRAISWGL